MDLNHWLMRCVRAVRGWAASQWRDLWADLDDVGHGTGCDCVHCAETRRERQLY